MNFLIDIIYYSIGLAFLLNKIIWTVRLIKWTAAIVKGVYLNFGRMELICMTFMHNQSVQADTNPLKKFISPSVDSAGVAYVYFRIKYERD